MNIFVTDINSTECAKFLDDKRVIKMVLESAQLLSTAINECGGKGPYKTTHKNHPCSIWVRKSSYNYNWLFNHFRALLAEYTARYGKKHKCNELTADLYSGRDLIPIVPFTPFINCTSFKDEQNVYIAYKKYLREKWLNDRRSPTWYGETSSEFTSLDKLLYP
jgi:hypothetical protein